MLGKKNRSYHCKVTASWDWENNKNTILFTGIDENGIEILRKSILDN